MAAESSAYVSAPESDISPPTTHTTKTMPGEPTFRTMSLGTMKIPLPITVPTTRATAAHKPRTRFSDTGCEVGEFMNWEGYHRCGAACQAATAGVRPTCLAPPPSHARLKAGIAR